MRRFWIVVIGFFVCSSVVVAGEKLTYIDLINRLTDLERLATLPCPGEECAQWSSYDRASKYDHASCKYIDWSANGDEIVVAPGEYTLIAFVDRLDQVIETDETSSYVLIRHVVVPSP